MTRFHEKPVFSLPSYLVLLVSPRHCWRRTGFMIANSSWAAQIIKLEREGRHNGKKRKDYQSFSILQVRVITLTAHSHYRHRHRGLCGGRCNTRQHLICSGFYQFSSNLQLFNRNRNLCHRLDNEDAALKTKSLAQISPVSGEMAAQRSHGSLNRTPNFNSPKFTSVKMQL